MTEKKAVEQAQAAVDEATAVYRKAGQDLSDAQRELHLAMASESNESADRRAAATNIAAAREKARRESEGAAKVQ